VDPFREDILQAGDFVVVEYGGKQYALIADMNYWRNDPLVDRLSSLPTYGTAGYRLMQIGGKIGVVQDPFGPDAKYLGATTPIAGGAIRNLSIGEDGLLYASVWNYEPNYDMFAATSSSLYTWNAAALVQAAIQARATEYRPIDRDVEGGVGKMIPEASPTKYDIFNGLGWAWDIASSSSSDWPTVLSVDHDVPTQQWNFTPAPPVATTPSVLQSSHGLISDAITAYVDAVFGNGYLLQHALNQREVAAGNITYEEAVRRDLKNLYVDPAEYAASGALGLVSASLHNLIVESLSVKAGYSKELAEAAFEEFKSVSEVVVSEVMSYLKNGETDGHALDRLFAALVPISQALGGSEGYGAALLSKTISGLLETSLAAGETVSPARIVPASGSGILRAEIGNSLSPFDPVSPRILGGTSVKDAAGNVVFTAPPAASMTLDDASRWYSSQLAKLATLTQSNQSAYLQARNAYQLRDMLRSAAGSALIDSGQVDYFNTWYATPSFDNLVSEFSGDYSGSALYKNVLGEIISPKEPIVTLIPIDPWTPEGMATVLAGSFGEDDAATSPPPESNPPGGGALINHAPAGKNTIVTTPEGIPYVFKADDFGFSDLDDSPVNTFAAVVIDTLPQAGELVLGGNPVIAGQRILLADIVAGDLQFIPAANASGAVYASFDFQVQDDGGTANGGQDIDETPNTIIINVTPPADLSAETVSAFLMARGALQRGALVGATPVMQDAAVVNPLLTNSDFNGTVGWAISGDVAMASGKAMLGESSTGQTRINQVFTVGPNDQFLRFTIDSTSLGNPGDLPEDAFEAALLDANTGASLLGSIGLNQTDAFLNLQGDGRHLQEHVRRRRQTPHPPRLHGRG
jgi:hypothetical protein